MAEELAVLKQEEAISGGLSSPRGRNGNHRYIIMNFLFSIFLAVFCCSLRRSIFITVELQ